MLAPQSWVNYFKLEELLTSTGGANNTITTQGWQYNQSNPLKDATKLFYGNNCIIMHVRPHLDAFQDRMFASALGGNQTTPQSVLNKANDQTRRFQRFQAANADQINVGSELVMNIL